MKQEKEEQDEEFEISIFFNQLSSTSGSYGRQPGRLCKVQYGTDLKFALLL